MAGPFADLPPTPQNHFKLYFFGAVLRLLDQVAQSFGSRDAALEEFPFLAGYVEELAERGMEDLAGDDATLWWSDALDGWEAIATGHLPLRALREVAALDHAALTLLLTTGLLEEDARFGMLFETMQGIPGQHRPTAGLLQAWWRDADGCGTVRAALRHLLELGLVEVVNPEAPRIEWALQAPALLWDAFRGEVHVTPVSWARYRPPEDLPAFADLILPGAVRENLTTLPALLSSGEAQALIVRGPRHNGRSDLLGALGRALGRGMLELTGLSRGDDERWRMVGPLATVLRALPAAVFDLAPGETAEVPRLRGYDGPLGVVLNRQGGLSGPGVERALTVTLEMPDVETRLRVWRHSLDGRPIGSLPSIAERFRLTGGNIRRAASLAQSYAALAGRDEITLSDAQQAGRALNRQALDTLASPIAVTGDWNHLAVAAETLRELRTLESRCRHRERLASWVGPALATQLNSGVRALFSGPSGTGKTLAARLLASVLQMDLYRVDLSTVVNKYIGETEKNLNQIFARAEELDVILLLDEGDALLGQRTSVQTSTDRYANLETNYLLQRLEAFEGILIITTNAGDRIDLAFQRRMDVVIDFRAPDVAERWTIWQLHLPRAHAVPPPLLNEVVSRCSLTGGQIRNAVLHASLLALDDGGTVTGPHLEVAVQREYRKAGAVCPLRRAAVGTFN